MFSRVCSEQRLDERQFKGEKGLQTPIFNSDGTESVVEMAPAAISPTTTTNEGGLRPSWDFKDPALEAQRIEQNWRAIQRQLHPALAAAREQLEAKKLQTKRWAEVVEDLSRRRMEASALAVRARSSVFAEDYLRPQGLNGETPIPGRENRLNALTAELSEAKAEYSASLEELEDAQRLVTQLVQPQLERVKA